MPWKLSKVRYAGSDSVVGLWRYDERAVGVRYVQLNALEKMSSLDHAASMSTSAQLHTDRSV